MSTDDVKAVQAAAFARADEKMRPTLELHAERNRLMPLIYRVPLRDLVRLNQILARLSDEDLRRVAAFAEGLADWNADAPQEPNR